MINEEDRFNQHIEKTRKRKPVRPFPVSILVRIRKRYEGESYEDYRKSMRILAKAQKLIERHGGQYTLYYDEEHGRIIGL